jgi:hypothetical protein
MRRRTLLVVLAGLAVVVAAGVVVLWPRASQVTLENCQCICKGMTRFDVELILGGPPGDYRTRPTWDWRQEDDFMRSSFLFDHDRRVGHWYGDGVMLVVVFDPDDKVFIADSRHIGGPTASVLDTWKWQLKRQWHRWFLE